MSECMWGAVDSIPGPLVRGAGGDDLYVEARAPQKRTDRAILGMFGSVLLDWGQFLYGYDGFLVMLADDPGRAHDLLEKLTELHLTNLEQLPRPGRTVHRRDQLRRRAWHAKRTRHVETHVS